LFFRQFWYFVFTFVFIFVTFFNLTDPGLLTLRLFTFAFTIPLSVQKILHLKIFTHGVFKMADKRKIHVLSRQCATGKNCARDRPPWFSHEVCFRNLLATKDDCTDVTVILDGISNTHFAHDYGVNVVQVSGNSDAGAYFQLTRVFEDMYRNNAIQSDDIVYICEDDYVHRPGWPQVLREGLELFDYVTLYDHPDKYPGNPTQVDEVMRTVPAIQVSPTTHWRTACSTTNTVACLASTLLADLPVHKFFCTLSHVKVDHEQFLQLWMRGRTLGSCMPSVSTHCMTSHMAPLIDWKQVVQNTRYGGVTDEHGVTASFSIPSCAR
jgi:hypothetical protein